MKTYLQISDSIHIGPQPDRADLELLKQQGVKTVIDFRMPAETAGANRKLVMECGLNYVNIPVDKTALSESSIALLDAHLEREEKPFLLHCATGTRAAVLLSLRHARAEGWSFESTVQTIKEMGYDVSNSTEFLDFIREVTSNQSRT